MSKQRIVIVGGGLAGSFLALRLLNEGEKVILFDKYRPDSASRVAAGLFNIITGRYGAKSWQAELLLKEIEAFFAIPVCQSLQEYLHYTAIYRPFRDVKSYNKWVGRSSDPDFSHLVDFQEKPILNEMIKNDLGGIMVLPCGWVNTNALVDGMHELIQKLGGGIIREELAYTNIFPEKKTIVSDSFHDSFDHLVFCEGYRSENNPFFPQITIIPNKGDLLTIQAQNLQLPFVLSKKVFVIPLDVKEQTFLVGSTYKNNVRDTTASMESRDEICHYLEAAIRTPYQIIDQRAGVRPTTPNRRPIIGTHFDWKFVHVVTGLGTKGMLLGPWSTKLIADKIVGKEIFIPKEASLSRFSS